MFKPKFRHYDLELLRPGFDSKVTDLIIELDHLRRRSLVGSTLPGVFFQLKNIFHLMESVGSARIEGNNTTLVDYIDKRSPDESIKTQSIQEIINLEQAMDFIEETVPHHPINRIFVSELHKLVVSGLSVPPDGEGDPNPGVYRLCNVEISQSNHRPPDPTAVKSYMMELLAFIEHEDAPKYDLLKTAIAHHRFAWIHPFRNGNGRVVRLLTYAMLIKQGFAVNVGRIINPTAIFCSDRDMYYTNLSRADTGATEGILGWCEYVLAGLKSEIEKVDRLCDYEFLKAKILHPALALATDRGWISKRDQMVLARVTDQQLVQASDLKDLFKGKKSAEVSRQIKRLKDDRLLVAEEERKRKYHLCFQNKFLMMAIIHMLDENGFLPVLDRV